MKIYIGADHNGFAYRAKIADFVRRSGHDVEIVGKDTVDVDDDFPDIAAQVVNSMRADSDPDARGILICGSGQGVCMAANRFKGIRASLCWSIDEARSARNDDDSNVLCLSSRYLGLKEDESIVTVWLTTPFAAAPRFIRRIKQLDKL